MPKKYAQSRSPSRTRQSGTRSSLRIQLKGQRTPQELRHMLHRAVDEIETLAISGMTGINLYITPLDDDGNNCTPKRQGKPVSKLVIEAPYASAASEYGV